MTNDIKEKYISKGIELDHPCKQTCSGWQQGYDKGLESAQAKINELQEAVKVLRDGLRKYASKDNWWVSETYSDREEFLTFDEADLYKTDEEKFCGGKTAIEAISKADAILGQGEK